MNSGSITAEANSFRDLRRICKRSEMLLLDHQSRTESTGFQQNANAGKLVHEMIGWDKVVPESMSLYQAPSFPGEVSFRLFRKPPLEARMWMLEGIAGGIRHHVGAYHEDRRMYNTAQPVFQWHRTNQGYLIIARPLPTSAWCGRKGTPTTSDGMPRVLWWISRTSDLPKLCCAPIFLMCPCTRTTS